MNFMNLAIEKAKTTMRNNIGGPFGAVIVDSNGNILSIASNTVLGDHDPTAHAEINAIREACKKLNSHDLSGCTLYTTCYPCPMCLSAVIWANIKKVYYGCTAKDAENIGFRDDMIYKFISSNCSSNDIMNIVSFNREDCIKLFNEYSESKKTIY